MTEDPLRTELIKHLSGEIATNTQFLHTLRSRMAFNVLVGPFLALGSVVVLATKEKLNWPTGKWPWIGLSVVVVCYILFGVYGYLLDKFLTGQCDFLRGALISLAKNAPIGGVILEFPEEYKWNHKWAYIPVFLIMLLGAIGFLLLSWKIFAH